MRKMTELEILLEQNMTKLAVIFVFAVFAFDLSMFFISFR
jgi:hypothetical protein